MGEKNIGLKHNIENSLQKGIMEPLVFATGRHLLNMLPEKNSHLDKAEHSYLGFWGANSVVDAFANIPELTQDPLNTMIISDMDGPFVKLRPSITSRGENQISGVKLFEVDESQVFALEDANTPNLYATNRAINFPGTKKIIQQMQSLGVKEESIFLKQDKETGIFRDQKEFERMTQMIEKFNPKNLFLIFDIFNWPLTLINDVTGTSGHFLKDILHKMDIDQQKRMAVGMVGVSPLLKDTVFVPPKTL
jgi:hypothetical protein